MKTTLGLLTKKLILPRFGGSWNLLGSNHQRCLHCVGQRMADSAEIADTSTSRITQLKQRALLRVAGTDAAGLLQGLVTNDVEMLNSGSKMRAMYTMFLNVQGRVLYDALIYHQNQQDQPSYLIECDSAILPDLHKHIRLHKLRKKVDLSDVSSEFQVWSLFDKKQSQPSNSSAWIPDPRLSTFMYRAVTTTDTSVSDIGGGTEAASDEDYRRYRYEIGLAEGVLDFPPGDVLPLESNLAFLNGVDFSKGCYLGQELTARTHHTGVIRKRIMPVQLESPSEEVPPGSAIKTEKGRNAGKFRGQMGSAGIALLRVAHRDELLHIDLADGARCNLTAHVPPWWPKDFPH